MGKSKKHERKYKAKHKRKELKDKKRKSKKQSKEKKRAEERYEEKNFKIAAAPNNLTDDNSKDFSIPVELMNSKSHAPETPEEYQQRQQKIRRETDPITGRARLIKGDGEVLEEIVSKERHKTINKEATKGDGNFFQKNTLTKR